MGIFFWVYQDRRTLPEIFSDGLRCPESAYEHKVDIFFLVYQNGRTLPAIFSDGLRWDVQSLCVSIKWTYFLHIGHMWKPWKFYFCCFQLSCIFLYPWHILIQAIQGHMGIFLGVYQDGRTLPAIFSDGLRCPESPCEHKVDIFFHVYQDGRTFLLMFRILFHQNVKLLFFVFKCFTFLLNHDKFCSKKTI